VSTSLSASSTEGILTRRTDSRMKLVAWGRVVSMNNTRVPVYRVDIEMKSSKGIGSR
jgi:hypothetical protein